MKPEYKLDWESKNCDLFYFMHMFEPVYFFITQTLCRVKKLVTPISKVIPIPK